jgi:hypothetical protein
MDYVTLKNKLLKHLKTRKMSKTKSKFRGKVSRNVEKQKQDASSYGYLNMPKDVEILKLDEGRIQLDIMPYIVSDENHPDRDDKLEIAIPGELWYRRPFKIHRSIGSSNDSFVCPTSVGKKCPICEYRTKRMKEGADKEETDALKASLRNLYVVIPIGHKKLDEKPYLWDISQYLFQNLLNDELQENSDYEVFPDLEEGYALKIRFDEKSIGKNKFNEASRIDFVERKEVYEESILDEIPDLDKVLKILSYQELERHFLEIDDDDVADDDVGEVEETKPTRRKRPIEKDDKDEPEEEKKPIRRTRPEKEPEKKPGKSSDRCPHGHKFGVDTDKYDDCNKCKIWDDCIDEKEANE